MKNLAFDFTVDKTNKTVNVKREFAAGKNAVWSAWTEKEILDNWWAPKPWKADTKSMDFTEGGKWIYAMRGPEGEEHWSLAEYISIQPKDYFKAMDAFCDSDGNINKDFPQTKWKVDFEEKNEHTLVSIQLNFETIEDLEKLTEMGFKEGFTMAMENLDEIFAKQ
jgi:uncharacterized protein YndB with AHSA1/START domain